MGLIFHTWLCALVQIWKIFFGLSANMTEIFSDWIPFLAYPNLFGIKGFVVVVAHIMEQLQIDTEE
jgi:hypothetical protein